MPRVEKQLSEQQIRYCQQRMKCNQELAYVSLGLQVINVCTDILMRSHLKHPGEIRVGIYKARIADLVQVLEKLHVQVRSLI